MKKIIIWESTSVETGESFHVLQGSEYNMCAVYERGRLTVDEDFSSFWFNASNSRSSYCGFTEKKIVEVPWEPLVTEDQISMFCMLQGIDISLGPLLEFGYQKRKELYNED